jgi:hypothetical protein
MADLGTINVGAANSFGGYVFKLDQAPNFAEFAVFDEYSISRVDVSLIPDFNVNTDTALAHVSMPHLVVATDLNDALAPANEASLLSHSDAQVYNPGTRANISFVPSVSTSYWQNALATGFGSKQGAWIDMASSGVEHYALKYGLIVDANAVAMGQQYRVFVKFHFKFRKFV